MPYSNANDFILKLYSAEEINFKNRSPGHMPVHLYFRQDQTHNLLNMLTYLTLSKYKNYSNKNYAIVIVLFSI